MAFLDGLTACRRRRLIRPGGPAASKGEVAMADDEKLKPEDFPVHTEQKKIVKNDGKTIAEANDKKIAEDVAERLNAEEDRREEDRWSA
jgi:hypothetical protein